MRWLESLLSSHDELGGMILAEMQEPPWPDLWYVGLDSDCLLVRALCPLMAPNQSPLGPNWSPLGRLPLDLMEGALRLLDFMQRALCPLIMPLGPN